MANAKKNPSTHFKKKIYLKNNYSQKPKQIKENHPVSKIPTGMVFRVGEELQENSVSVARNSVFVHEYFIYGKHAIFHFIFSVVVFPFVNREWLEFLTDSKFKSIPNQPTIHWKANVKHELNFPAIILQLYDLGGVILYNILLNSTESTSTRTRHN